eukprot:3326396-Pleurochrysis_carterae.AAC.1
MANAWRSFLRAPSMHTTAHKEMQLRSCCQEGRTCGKHTVAAAKARAFAQTSALTDTGVVRRKAVVLILPGEVEVRRVSARLCGRDEAWVRAADSARLSLDCWRHACRRGWKKLPVTLLGRMQQSLTILNSDSPRNYRCR